MIDCIKFQILGTRGRPIPEAWTSVWVRDGDVWERREEQFDWCEENCRGQWTRVALCYYFAEARDATLFLLRWA